MKYHFWQFHFHWGSSTTDGSEHLVDGVRNAAKFISYMFVKITSITFLELWQILRVWLFWEFSLKEELMMMLILPGLILLLMLLWKLLRKETTHILSVMKPGST